MSRLLLAILLTLALAAPAHAVRLFTCGFEENDILNTMWTQNTGTAATIGSTSPHSGTYRMDTAAANGNSYLGVSLVTLYTSGTLHSRGYMRFVANPNVDTRITWNASSGGLLGAEVWLLTTGKLRLVNVVTATAADSTITASTGTWYRIEVEHVLLDSGGSMTVRIYDDAVPTASLLDTLTITGEDTLNTNVRDWRWGKFSSTASISWDDVGVNDSTGSVQTSWLGPGKIYMLVPNADVSIKSENTAGAADTGTFATIDELPGAKDDTDYNAFDSALDGTDNIIGSDATQFDRLGLTDPGAEVTSDAVINVVEVYGRIGSNQTSATHIQFLLWDESSTKTTGPTMAANVNGWRLLTSSTESLVYDPAGKTKANLSSFNVGYQALTDTITSRPRRIAALWVNVEWTEAVGGATLLQQSSGFLGSILK